MNEIKPTIFLSYGHRDAEELADRIRGDLASGYDVWKDTTGIRTGRAWTDEIRNGIRASQLLIAILSPHSVRRALDSTNPNQSDSVCLDEIEYAVDACSIPVMPVMAITCEPPFRIFRLQYLDFRSWQESESRYETLRLQLEHSIARALGARRSSVREWGWLPEPWDFSPFLSARRRRFTGRDWVFREIEDWRKGARSPALLIVGRPGVGKSAIVAQLVHENLGGQVLAYHCCQADTKASLDPGLFVLGLAGQLSARLEGFAARLEHPAVRDYLSAAATGDDPASAFERGILAPLSSLPTPDEGVRYLLIDALDEAILRPKGVTILDLLGTRLDRFPPWLRIVATTQPQPEVLQRLGGIETRPIDASDLRNKGDVSRFISERLAERVFDEPIQRSGLTPDRIKMALEKASEGSFQFVTTFLDGVELRHLHFTGITTLPPGLWRLYRIYFDRLYGEHAGLHLEYEPTRKVLEVVVSAQSPPAGSEIARVLGIDADYELPRILQPIAAFLTVSEGTYGTFHQSLSDWLTARDRTEQPVAGKYHVSLRAGHGRWSVYYLRMLEGGAFVSSLVRSLPTHLVGAGRWDDVARVLLDPHFIQAKISGGTTTAFDLQNDCAMTLARMPVDHPGHQLVSALNNVVVPQSQNLRRADLSPLDQLILQARLNKSPQLAQILERAPPARRERFELRWSTYGPDPAFRRRWRLGDSYTYSISISADGSRAVCAGDRGDLILLDLNAGDVAGRIRAHAGEHPTCRISANGKRAITQGENGNEIHVWEFSPLRRLRVLKLEEENPWPWGLSLSAEGRYLLTCNQGEGTPLLSIWDLDNGDRSQSLDQPGLPRASCAAMAFGASRVLSVHPEGKMVLWDMQRAVIIDSTGVDNDDGWTWTACDISSDGTLAVAGGGKLVVWDTVHRTVSTAPAPPGGTWGDMDLALSADGRRALSGASEGLVVAWDLNPDSPPRVLWGNTRNDVWSVAVSADGRRGLSVTKGGNTVEWDLERIALGDATRAGHGDWIWSCAMSSEALRSATLSAERLMVWDNRSGQLVGALNAPGSSSGKLVLNDSGSRASFTTVDFQPTRGGTAVGHLETRYWNLANAKELSGPDDQCPPPTTPTEYEDLWTRFGLEPPPEFPDWEDGAPSRRLNLDVSGRLLYTSAEGKLRTWRVEGLVPQPAIPVTGESVEYCALIEEDRLLVVSDDGTVMIWDLRSENVSASLCIGEVTCACSNADGSFVLLGNGVGDVFGLERREFAQNATFGQRPSV